MLAKSDVHGLWRGVSEVGDPKTEDLSPRKVAGDMNSNDRTANAVFSYCSLAVNATPRWTMANLGRSGRRVERRTDARGYSRATNGLQVCSELKSDKEGDTNSQRLRVCRPVTQSARVVVRNDSQHCAPTFPRASRREGALIRDRPQREGAIKVGIVIGAPGAS
jgi:hypothetical protein